MSDALPPVEQRQALYAQVDAAFESRQVELLRRLVLAPSFTETKADVEYAACVLDDAMAALGWRITRHADPRGTFADHRVYTPPLLADGDRALGLVGHIDTVFPRSLGFLDFTREGDVVRGPGVLDMKSGLTAIVFAIAAVQQVCGAAADTLPARFVCVSDEEVGSPSSEPVLRGLAPSLSAALVFEAGRVADQIVTMRKGGGMFELSVVGKSAHAGNEHAAGVNAIHALALLVPRIEALTDYSRGVTVNVGVIRGGTSKNTVPEHASCQIDTRFDAIADANRVIAALREIAAEPFALVDVIPEKLRAVTASLTGAMTRPPMEATAASQALRLRYEACACDVGLGIGEAPRQGGGSDGNLLAAFGVPTIDGLGPAGQYFHNPREWCSLASLARRTKALACMLAQELMPKTAG